MFSVYMCDTVCDHTDMYACTHGMICGHTYRRGVEPACFRNSVQYIFTKFLIKHISFIS